MLQMEALCFCCVFLFFHLMFMKNYLRIVIFNLYNKDSHQLTLLKMIGWRKVAPDALINCNTPILSEENDNPPIEKNIYCCLSEHRNVTRLGRFGVRNGMG